MGDGLVPVTAQSTLLIPRRGGCYLAQLSVFLTGGWVSLQQGL